MYKIILIIFILLSIVFLIGNIILLDKNKKILNNKYLKESNKYKNLIENEKRLLNENYEAYKENIINKKIILDNSIKEKESESNQIDELIKYKKNTLHNIEKEWTILLNKFLLQKQNSIKSEITEKSINILSAVKDDFIQQLDNICKDYLNKKEKYQDELNNLLIELNEFKKKREAITKSILLEKKEKEDSKFYKIILSDKTIEDIKMLQEISIKLNNKNILNKIIYEVYCKVPFQDMVKRVLENKEFSGIYKITYINTGESYIGKSTNIKKRWNDHLKTALGVEGGASKSYFHDKMSEYGFWNFTFQVLEKVDKDRLSEREKYYIELYDTKNQLNTRSGG